MKKRMVLTFILIASLLSTNFAVGSEEDLSSIKRLGRGIGDRASGESLQLACVGDLKDGTTERGCEKLRFLFTDESGRESLMGPVMDLSDTEKNPSRKIREELQCYGLFRNTQTGRFFMVSRKLIPVGKERRSRCMKRKYSTLNDADWQKKLNEFHERERKKTKIPAMVTMGVGGVGAYLITVGVSSAVAGYLFIPAVFATGFAIDAVTYPFRFLLDNEVGPLGVLAGNVEVLESRAKTAWQLKPKWMSHSRFQKIIDRLGAIDAQHQGENETSLIESNPMNQPDEWVEVEEG